MKIHITSIFLLFTLLSCGQNKTEDTKSSTKYDVSSKEKIKKAMEEIDGKEYSDRAICDRKSRNFEDLILIGYFAYDRGCKGDKAFYKGQYINPVENAATILYDHNWKKNKEQLAIDFTKDVITAWESVLRKYDIKEDSNTFHVPQSKIIDNGDVEVICWVKEPTGMRPVNDYYRLKVVFDKKGNISSTEKIGSKSIPILRDQEEKEDTPSPNVTPKK